MFIRCLFTIAGYILTSLGGITTNAQDEKTSVFDKIVCSELLVVRKAGKLGAYIGVTENSGGIGIHNKAGKAVANIVTDADGNGIIQTYKGGWRIH